MSRMIKILLPTCLLAVATAPVVAAEPLGMPRPLNHVTVCVPPELIPSAPEVPGGPEIPPEPLPPFPWCETPRHRVGLPDVVGPPERCVPRACVNEGGADP